MTRRQCIRPWSNKNINYMATTFTTKTKIFLFLIIAINKAFSSNVHLCITIFKPTRIISSLNGLHEREYLRSH